MKLKKISIKDILLFLLSFLFFIVFLANIVRLFLDSGFITSPVQKIIIFVISLYYSLCGFSGILSFFLKEKQKILVKIFAFGLMTLFLFFPFALIISLYIPLILYLFMATGMFLFRRYK